MTEGPEGMEQPLAQHAEVTDTPASQQVTGTPAPQPESGISGPSYVYAIGNVRPTFPSLDVEREFAQVTGRAEELAGLTDREALQDVLSERANRYLVRQLCWVFTIEGLETYILQPRDPADFDLLVEAVRPAPRATDVDVVIGMRGPIAPPEACNGLMVPIVVFDQLYSFDVEELIGALERPDGIEQDRWETASEEVFHRITQLADNAGAIDEHRALNYLAVRYQAIYQETAERFGDNYRLTGVDVRPSRLSGPRRIVDVIFSYTHRQTDVTEKQFVRVDVSGEFPFLVTKMSPYYQR